MSFGKKLNSIILNVLSAAKMNTNDYSDIETIDDQTTIVFKNRSMMTLVRYDGLLSTIDEDVFFDMTENMAAQLRKLMRTNGYKIACVFRKDLDAQSSLRNVEAIQKQTTRGINLDLDDLIEENVDMYRDSVYDEEVYFALITQPCVLDKVETDNSMEQRSKINAPAFSSAQNLVAPIEALRAKHSSFVEKFMSTLSNPKYFVQAEVVNVLTSLAFIRHQVLPDLSSMNWLPSVALGTDVADKWGYPGYVTPICWPTSDEPDDLSYLFPPSLPKQIMSKATHVLGSNEGVPPYTIATGGRVFSSVVMNIPPSQPDVFDSLFNAFNQSSSVDNRGKHRTMPWSIAYMITSDTQSTPFVQMLLKDILAKVPPSTNETMRAAYNQLSYLRRAEEAIVGLQISAMTWAEDTPQGRKKLGNRKTRLSHIMESWGNMNVIDNMGDPTLAFQGNILGLSDKHYGPKGAAPLARALELLPLTRPASPFKKGTVLFKTLDGKLMLHEKFSGQMNTWVSCMVGTPGSGKSVYMNNLLTETCMMPGIERLPFITIIDKGISSTGFINLIRDALPTNQKHLAVNKKLRKSEPYSINFLDIKVGLRFPLEFEKDQMVSFLTALLTPAETTEPYVGTQAFVSYLIDQVFRLVQEDAAEGDPKMYAYGYNSELDRYIDKYEVIDFKTTQKERVDGGIDIEVDREDFKRISAFELTQKLHIMAEKYPEHTDGRIELYRARDLAHRAAMPILPDIVKVLRSKTTKAIYTNKITTGESMVDFAQRTIKEVTSIYPCFSNTTRFDVDSARIVALDLQEVLDKNNRWQSSLFLQVARMVGIKKISLSEEDFDNEGIPPLFHDYYVQQLRNLDSDRKVLAIDEMHNAKGDKALMKLLETDAREGRKWGLELMFASQNLTDFDFGTGNDEEKVKLLAYVTHLCVCSIPRADDLASFKKYFSAEAGVEREMKRIGLSREGLTYLSYITAKNDQFCSLITSTVGPKRLWSLTTDQDDRLIRNIMMKIAGNRQLAIAALAYYFPDGARSRIQEIRTTIDTSKALSKEDIEEQTSGRVQSLAHTALTQYEAEVARRRQEQRMEAAYS